jgi:hypothetical protein
MNMIGDEDDDGYDSEGNDENDENYDINYDNDSVDQQYDNDEQFFSHTPVSLMHSPTRSILKLVTDGK